MGEDSGDKTEEPTPQPDGKSTEAIVREAVESFIAAGADPDLDPIYFTAEEMVDGIVRNRDGKPTQMRTKELQLAISFLEDQGHAVMRSLVYPSAKGPFFGKTFGEVLEMEQGAVAIDSCIKLLQKDYYPAYAAALILRRESDAK